MKGAARFADALALAVVPFVASLFMRLLSLTVRFEYVNDGEARSSGRDGRQAIYAFWHGRIMMLPFGYFGSDLTGFVSQHRDGEFLARSLLYFGIRCERGSSTRGWLGGLKGVLRAAKRGSDLAYAPDGPKGPARVAKDGVVQIARSTGLPVIPLTYGVSKKKVLSSWDSFTVPIPFSKGVFIYGDPVEVARDSTAEVLEAKRQEIEDVLNEITERADTYFKGG